MTKEIFEICIDKIGKNKSIKTINILLLNGDKYTFENNDTVKFFISDDYVEILETRYNGSFQGFFVMYKDIITIRYESFR